MFYLKRILSILLIWDDLLPSTLYLRLHETPRGALTLRYETLPAALFLTSGALEQSENFISAFLVKQSELC